MNVELLKQVRRRILADPQKFRMDVWTCGTAHCIAGWTCALKGLPFIRNEWNDGFDSVMTPLRDGTVRAIEVDDAAIKALGISHKQADRLFHVEMWPEAIAERYNKARTRKARAAIAAERIDHFIATKGAE